MDSYGINTICDARNFWWLFRQFFYLVNFFFLSIISLFFRANIKWCTFRKTNSILGQNHIYEVIIVTLITSTIAYFNPYTRKSASALIKQVINYKF